MSAEIRRSNGRVWLVDLARGEQTPFEDDLVGAAISVGEHRDWGHRSQLEARPQRWPGG